MSYKPAPGIVLVSPIESSSSLIIKKNNNALILKGKVLAMGREFTTLASAVLKPEWYCKVGDTVLFLTYNEKNDQFEEDKKTYYVVQFQDIRAVEDK